MKSLINTFLYNKLYHFCNKSSIQLTNISTSINGSKKTGNYHHMLPLNFKYVRKLTIYKSH